jgi:hypothetical protein
MYARSIEMTSSSLIRTALFFLCRIVAETHPFILLSARRFYDKLTLFNVTMKQTNILVQPRDVYLKHRRLNTRSKVKCLFYKYFKR